MVQTLHAGLSDQTLSRYLYDLGHSPPKFEQYTRWLRDVRPNDTVYLLPGTPVPALVGEEPSPAARARCDDGVLSRL